MAALAMAVIERLKEIGVMRSIGASSRVVMSQFMLEGMIIGLIAWLAAIPFSMLIGQGVDEHGANHLSRNALSTRTYRIWLSRCTDCGCVGKSGTRINGVSQNRVRYSPLSIIIELKEDNTYEQSGQILGLCSQ